MTQGLTCEGFKISGNSVSAAVCVIPQNLRVTESLANTVLSLRPTLAEHICKHRGFGYFGDKLIGTTLPHLVEHLAIDLLVEGNQLGTDCDTELAQRADETTSRASDKSPDSPSKALAGMTTWLDREQGRMLIRLSCTSQSIEETCAAITHAITLVNALFEQ